MADIPSHIGPVVLRPWHGADADTWIRTPGDVVSARLWLARGVGDDASTADLRLAALGLADGSDLSRLDDQQLVDHLAAAAAEGRLRTPVVPVELFKLVMASTGHPASSPAALASRAAASADPPSAPDTTFGGGLNSAAMAAVLVRAARDGVPFCEECAETAGEDAP